MQLNGNSILPAAWYIQTSTFVTKKITDDLPCFVIGEPVSAYQCTEDIFGLDPFHTALPFVLLSFTTTYNCCSEKPLRFLLFGYQSQFSPSPAFHPWVVPYIILHKILQNHKMNLLVSNHVLPHSITWFPSFN